jgi:uncharacterized Zn finger protein (UPF0148 family)
MHTHAIRDLMDYWSHCHECGALLVAVPGGSICPHCGFELEEPEEGAVLAFGKAAKRAGDSAMLVDDWPEAVFDEVA